MLFRQLVTLVSLQLIISLPLAVLLHAVIGVLFSESQLFAPQNINGNENTSLHNTT